MSKYDKLDVRTELEQTIFGDIKNAFEKRRFNVKHNGSPTSHAPAGLPDIEVWDDIFHINVEITKSKGASQDRELNSIRDHLNQIKDSYADKDCYCIFASPETSKRMLDGIKDHNRQRDAEGNRDLKILPMSFDTIEIYLQKLTEAEADLYPLDELTNVFTEYNEFIDDLRIKKLLFERIFPTDRELSEKVEEEFISSGMFTESDNLPDTVTDDFIKDNIIPVLGGYRFIGTKIDALGAVYEVLALRAEKDVKVGQFFTPENIVKFMVKLAELDVNDYVLDPACGTGRFLIYGMRDMLEKAKRSSVRNKKELMELIAKHQLFGADIDIRIAKIAKMNMWIHGDGKSNIFGGKEYNGLTLHKHGFNEHDTFENAFDVVMTNPPLGELNYQVIDTGNNKNIKYKLERIPFLPHKNKTKEKLKEIREKLRNYGNEVRELNQKKAEIKSDQNVNEFISIPEKPSTQEQRKRIKELKSHETVKEYLGIEKAIKQKQKTINNNRERERELEAKVRSENVRLVAN